MPLEQGPEGAEDVNDFLVRIRELGEKRDKEDEERTRKLEEEILQGRREREARRAERARSISPTKDSPPILGSLIQRESLLSASTSSQSIVPPVELLPTTKSLDLDLISRDTAPDGVDTDINNQIDGDSKGNTENYPPPSSRSRAMSWRQRLLSRDIEPLTSLKFLGDLTPITPEKADRGTSATESDSTMSREQIAQSLGSKDPSWFKQTSDRGIGSQAYRRAPNASLSELQLSGGTIKLPGLSKESPIALEASYDNGEKSRSPSRASSVYGGSSFGNRYSSVSASGTSGLGSPVPLSSTHRLDGRPPSSSGDNQTPDRVTMSPSQSRLASDRPSSPTKGLGGFVQSAMMKRSDSVSKRWSAQPGSNTFRNSFISTRGDLPGSRASFQSSKLQATSTAQEPISRPGSSHSEATVVRHSSDENPAPNTENEAPKDGTTPSNRIGRSSFSYSGSRPGSVSTPDDLPITPSKTMDPKRWSPTKASWLESALNKPEFPRLKTPKTPHDPEWKKDFTHKLRSSRDIGRSDKSQDSYAEPTMGREKLGDRDPGMIEALKSSDSHTTSPGKVHPAGSETPFETTSSSIVEDTTKDKPQSQYPAIPPESQELELKIREASRGNTPVVSPIARSPNSPIEKVPSSLGTSNPPGPRPPVNDFRANLRRREAPIEKPSNDEPEFKSVFGKLRRTETKNYVAPNELKENILKGKAALNATGGPRKTPRVDEFKDSILKQKEAMKVGGGSIRRTTNDDRRLPGAPQSPIPEAIARRNALNRSDSTRSNISTSSGIPLTPKPFQSKFSHSNTESEPSLRSGQTSPVKQPEKEHAPEQLPVASIPDPSRKIPEDAQIKTHSPLPSSPAPRPRSETVKSKLADRLNPALAGILARGPPSETKPASANSVDIYSTRCSQESSAAPLTHMTKSRAKGPKRRLPQKVKAERSQSTPQADDPFPPGMKLDDYPTDISLTKSMPGFTEQLGSLNINGQETAMPSSRVDSLNSLPKSNNLHSDLSSKNLAVSKPELLPSTTSSEPKEPARLISKPSPLSINTEPKDNPRAVSNYPASPLGSSQSPIIPKKPRLYERSSAHDIKQPSHLSTASGEEAGDSQVTGLKSHPSRDGISSYIGKRVVSPPVPPKPSSINTAQSNSQGLVSSNSPFPQTPEAARLFSTFFDVAPSAKHKVDIDPSAILSSNSVPSPKTKTLRRQIWEFGNDGKRRDLPANQEYILFEQSMYLCIHTFETANGSRTTQTHLWCGDGISEGTIEDAQLFARKLARENNSKLEILRQGKETANFIQALGGIILTRRGSSSRADSPALYMLCGRRHLGQIAFDEVDMTRQSLCSGYPFILSAKFGNLYLWKGRGSTADELGCARLIGMDLGLTGEIEEITEGEEPSSFFDCFPNSHVDRTYPSADHWRFKANNEKFCSRLFRIDHGLGQGFGAAFWNRRGANSPVTRPNDTVQSIEPFCQRELDSGHIYVLDAFFEIYVIVGGQAFSRSAEFASALVFAQEYGFLAVSEQDRPFLPKSYVVLNGLTEECKRAFRKWDDRLDGFSNGQPVRVLPLNAAIEAIR
ncbi:hypothetical protein CIHG_00345 [Coccidioides immitis H538.4]|uniref:Uncharacterized protein n=1 Tax=Coccidioides immitis H538.4 TaxID=396776 RepID=A0A0J8RF26_COCIT|nr:hypothetical protein CIHG_00345 [Coccidioides immitis H538.4]